MFNVCFAAFKAYAFYFSLFSADRSAYGLSFKLMPRGGYGIIFARSAQFTYMIFHTVFFTFGLDICNPLAERVPYCVGVILIITVAADRANIFVVSILGARWNVNCLDVVMSVAVVSPRGVYADVARYLAAVVAGPAVERIACLRRRGQFERVAVGHDVAIKHGRAIEVEEVDRVLVLHRFHHSAGGNINRCCCGDHIRNTVAVDVPTDENFGCGAIIHWRDIRLTNDFGSIV